MAFMEQSFTASSLQGILYHSEGGKSVPVFMARETPENFIVAFSKRYSKHSKKNYFRNKAAEKLSSAAVQE